MSILLSVYCPESVSFALACSTEGLSLLIVILLACILLVLATKPSMK